MRTVQWDRLVKGHGAVRENAHLILTFLFTILFGIEALIYDIPHLFSRPLVLNCFFFAGMVDTPFNAD